MQVVVTALALALLGQLGAERYPGGPSADPTGAGAATAPAVPPEVADPASSSTITVAGDTPQPTLVDDGGVTPTGNGVVDVPPPSAPAAITNPFDKPLAAPAQVAPRARTSSPAIPPAETSVLTTGPKPADLMRQLLKPPTIGQLPGVPVTLGAAVRDAANRTAQTERARAYWNLSAAVAQYYLALQEAAELDATRQGILKPSDAWTAAAEDANRRIELTRQTASAAQMNLHRLMGATAGVSLPLPADSPHCGRYNTRFDEIFTARQDPAARQLNDLLPKLHGELSAGAQQVADAVDWLTFVSTHRDSANDGTGLLRAYELMAARRRAFIDAARLYNDQIAAYSELAAPNEVNPDRLVAMLIRVSSTNGGGAPDSGAIQPTSATEDAAVQPIAQDNDQPTDAASRRADGAQRTFAFRPLAWLRNRERSIVTNRLLLRRPGRDSD